jgi:hypothetical protein
MMSKEWQFKQEYSDIVAAFQKAFPDVVPPAQEWIFLWLAKYPSRAIKDAIRILEQHPLKARFTTISCGKAMSSLLRTEALKRAMASTDPTAVSR